MAGWPVRFSVMSYNLWNDQRWAERRPALESFLSAYHPDILGVQELRAVTRDFLDSALPGHHRVDDAFEGWTVESNLWWRADLFDEVAHGAEVIEHYEALRRLFWVRLQPRSEGAPTVLVATVHFTWVGNPHETAGGPSPRPRQARLAGEALQRMRRDGEPVILMGDLNDAEHPIRILVKECGFSTTWLDLKRSPQPTWPAIASHGAPQAIDWILHCGPIRPLTMDVIDFYPGDLPPSDHKPIQTVFELVGNGS